MKALTAHNLEKVYKTGTHALKGISLEIPEGDFFALLGPNGAGKTTLIGIVTGIVTKTGGTASVFGHDIDSDHERAKACIGVVPQEMNINIFEKVSDIVINQAGYYGIPRSEAIPRTDEILQALGLYEKKDEKSMNLSGGMKRRLMIARALVHQPKFLILDEPTAGVDVELRRGMWEYLKKINKEGMTILLTTHYLEEAEQLAKHVAIVNKGGIIAQGTMKELLAHLTTEVVFLDLVKPITDSALQDLALYNPKKVDETTVSVEIGAGRGVSDAILSLHQNGFPVQTVRAQSGKLEEVFMHLTKENAS
jgi:ABC-2 type transport system ATP-binding protein